MYCTPKCLQYRNRTYYRMAPTSGFEKVSQCDLHNLSLFAVKQNRRIPVVPFLFKLTVKPGSIRSGFGTECKTEYPVTDLLSFKTRFQTPLDGSRCLHPVPFLTHLLKRQHLARLFL